MKIAAGEFKAQCLKLMDAVERNHEEIVITKHGKAVAKLVPISKRRAPRKSGYGCMKGTAKTLGNIVSPIGEVWDAER